MVYNIVLINIIIIIILIDINSNSCANSNKLERTINFIKMLYRTRYFLLLLVIDYQFA